MRRLYMLLILICLGFEGYGRDLKQPKLVVNIVVSNLSPHTLAKYKEGFSAGGFNLFENSGVIASEAKYNFMQTLTPATLTTLTTGTDPSLHGIVTSSWIDYIRNSSVDLIADPQAIGLGCDDGLAKFSAKNLAVPTLGDMVKEANSDNNVVSLAIDPTSAIIMGGGCKDVYWVDDSRFSWVSSSAYMDKLPEWIETYNEQRVATNYLNLEWKTLLETEKYKNRVYTDVDISGVKGKIEEFIHNIFHKSEINKDYNRLKIGYVGNILVTEFAKEIAVKYKLGLSDKPNQVDLLNICYDSPRYVAEHYGDNTMEFEDVIYRLDFEIENLISMLSTQVGAENLLVVLTSDHGSSRAQGIEEKKLFNAGQFKVLLSSFLGSQYGSGEWVVGYSDRQIYLNHNLIYQKNLNLEEVQSRAAAFALQFRGVSHVLTATALQSSYFADGYGKMIQSSFYPKRCGDIVLNLMPGWIEADKNARVLSGSMYDYDTKVPLMLYGCGVKPTEIIGVIDMKDVAPTLAQIMNVDKPIASTGEPIRVVLDLFEK